MGRTVPLSLHRLTCGLSAGATRALLRLCDPEPSLCAPGMDHQEEALSSRVPAEIRHPYPGHVQSLRVLHHQGAVELERGGAICLPGLRFLAIHAVWIVASRFPACPMRSAR